MTAKRSKSSDKSIPYVVLKNGDQLKVGDSLLILGETSDGEKCSLPFIGLVKALVKHKKKPIQVAWYYRPEDCKAKRRTFHGEKELFTTDHTDWIGIDTVDEKCTVYSLAEYKDLVETGETEFYARFHYDHAKDRFSPETVPVYCKCEMPYNPDLYMLMCEKCEEWYHPNCIGLKNAQVKQYDKDKPFICPDCLKQSQALSGKKRERSHPNGSKR